MRTVELPLAQYYRANGLDIVFTVEATDGLNRAAEAPELVALGRSITDAMVQRLYREWAFAVAFRIQPAYQELLLDSAKATGAFQLTFYDLDLSANPPPPGSILPLFTHLGLADSAMTGKPALAVWDSILQRPYRSP